jgi:hypothetical protein
MEVLQAAEEVIVRGAVNYDTGLVPQPLVPKR